jgi:hypothetical protein
MAARAGAGPAGAFLRAAVVLVVGGHSRPRRGQGLRLVSHRRPPARTLTGLELGTITTTHRPTSSTSTSKTRTTGQHMAARAGLARRGVSLRAVVVLVVGGHSRPRQWQGLRLVPYQRPPARTLPGHVLGTITTTHRPTSSTSTTGQTMAARAGAGPAGDVSSRRGGGAVPGGHSRPRQGQGLRLVLCQRPPARTLPGLELGTITTTHRPASSTSTTRTTRTTGQTMAARAGAGPAGVFLRAAVAPVLGGHSRPRQWQGLRLVPCQRPPARTLPGLELGTITTTHRPASSTSTTRTTRTTGQTMAARAGAGPAGGVSSRRGGACGGWSLQTKAGARPSPGAIPAATGPRPARPCAGHHRHHTPAHLQHQQDQDNRPAPGHAVRGLVWPVEPSEQSARIARSLGDVARTQTAGNFLQCIQ